MHPWLAQLGPDPIPHWLDIIEMFDPLRDADPDADDADPVVYLQHLRHYSEVLAFEHEQGEPMDAAELLEAGAWEAGAWDFLPLDLEALERRRDERAALEAA